MTTITEFLDKNNIVPTADLPLVHSTTAYALTSIIRSGKIAATDCDVFKQDRLVYFFVGRPAYKKKFATGQAPNWQLPVCFIIEFQSSLPIRRMFPFDSGAFLRKILPDYITMMPIEKFLLNDGRGAAKLIGAFFASNSAYLNLSPKEKSDFKSEFSLSVWDAEIQALLDLAHDSKSAQQDDRRLCIEVQSDADFELTHARIMAVIAPTIYLDNEEIRDTIVNDWNAQPITYDLHPLASENYISTIYSKVLDFYRDREIV